MHTIYTQVKEAFRHVVRQGKWAMAGNLCAYLTKEGDSCVVGWWMRDRGIPVDDMPNKSAEGVLKARAPGVKKQDRMVLQAAQVIHDYTSRFHQQPTVSALLQETSLAVKQLAGLEHQALAGPRVLGSTTLIYSAGELRPVMAQILQVLQELKEEA